MEPKVRNAPVTIGPCKSVTLGPIMPPMEPIDDPQAPLQAAIDSIGLARLARELGLTHQAVRKWQVAGRMPRTEWTGETHYAETIEQLTAGAVTKAMLLAPWPTPPEALQGPLALNLPDAATEDPGQGPVKFAQEVG